MDGRHEEDAKADLAASVTEMSEYDFVIKDYKN